jgi:TPR repeat protein
MIMKMFSFGNEKLEALFRNYSDQSKCFVLNNQEIEIAEYYFNRRLECCQEKDLDRINKLTLLESFANIGHPVAQYKLAMRVGMSDITKSKDLMFRSAAQGYPRALYELCVAYRSIPELYDIEPNTEISEMLCQKASDLGHDQAKCELLSILLFDTYPRRDDMKDVIEKLKKLAEQNNKFARDFLDVIADMSEEELEEFINTDE